jgi:hypothetical protein
MDAFPVEKSNELKEPSKSCGTYEPATVREIQESGNINVMFQLPKKLTHLYPTTGP